MPPDRLRPTFKQMVGAIPKPKLDAPGTVRFSFKYAELPRNGKFSLQDCGAEYFSDFVDRLKHLSGVPTGEFLTRCSKGVRNHTIRFHETTEPDGFRCLPANIRDEAMSAAHQFAIDRDYSGRVHGFIVGDVFFVVWLDQRHELYP